MKKNLKRLKNRLYYFRKRKRDLKTTLLEEKKRLKNYFTYKKETDLKTTLHLKKKGLKNYFT